MLSPAERLRRAGLFKRVFAQKQSVPCPLFTLYVMERNAESVKRSDKMPLAGFVVSKKVFNLSVDRNRAKRRIRESYRKLRLVSETRDELGLSRWYALVWVIHSKALTSSPSEVNHAVLDCLARARAKFQKSGRRDEMNGGASSKPKRS